MIGKPTETLCLMLALLLISGCSARAEQQPVDGAPDAALHEKPRKETDAKSKDNAFRWEVVESFDDSSEFPFFRRSFGADWPYKVYKSMYVGSGTSKLIHTAKGYRGKGIEVFWGPNPKSEAQTFYGFSHPANQDYFRCEFYLEVFADHAPNDLKFDDSTRSLDRTGLSN